MKPIELNEEYDMVKLPSQQQQETCSLTELPERLKCGEVFPWSCADELYAVECNLCEDHPICPLSEFSQHMDVWHNDWEETADEVQDLHDLEEDLYDDEDQLDEDEMDLFANDNEELNDDLYFSFTTEDSGLYEQDDDEEQEDEEQEDEEQESEEQEYEIQESKEQENEVENIQEPQYLLHNINKVDDLLDQHSLQEKLNEDEILELFEQVLSEQEDNRIKTPPRSENYGEEERVGDNKHDLKSTEGDLLNKQQHQQQHKHKQDHKSIKEHLKQKEQRENIDKNIRDIDLTFIASNDIEREKINNLKIKQKGDKCKNFENNEYLKNFENFKNLQDNEKKKRKRSTIVNKEVIKLNTFLTKNLREDFEYEESIKNQTLTGETKIQETNYDNTPKCNKNLETSSKTLSTNTPKTFSLKKCKVKLRDISKETTQLNLKDSKNFEEYQNSKVQLNQNLENSRNCKENKLCKITSSPRAKGNRLNQSSKETIKIEKLSKESVPYKNICDFEDFDFEEDAENSTNIAKRNKSVRAQNCSTSENNVETVEIERLSTEDIENSKNSTKRKSLEAQKFITREIAEEIIENEKLTKEVIENTTKRKSTLRAQINTARENAKETKKRNKKSETENHFCDYEEVLIEKSESSTKRNPPIRKQKKTTVKALKRNTREYSLETKEKEKLNEDFLTNDNISVLDRANSKNFTERKPSATAQIGKTIKDIEETNEIYKLNIEFIAPESDFEEERYTKAPKRKNSDCSPETEESLNYEMLGTTTDFTDFKEEKSTRARKRYNSDCSLETEENLNYEMLTTDSVCDLEEESMNSKEKDLSGLKEEKSTRERKRYISDCSLETEENLNYEMLTTDSVCDLEEESMNSKQKDLSDLKEGKITQAPKRYISDCSLETEENLNYEMLTTERVCDLEEEFINSKEKPNKSSKSSLKARNISQETKENLNYEVLISDRVCNLEEELKQSGEKSKNYRKNSLKAKKSTKRTYNSTSEKTTEFKEKKATQDFFDLLQNVKKLQNSCKRKTENRTGCLRKRQTRDTSLKTKEKLRTKDKFLKTSNSRKYKISKNSRATNKSITFLKERYRKLRDNSTRQLNDKLSAAFQIQQILKDLQHSSNSSNETSSTLTTIQNNKHVLYSFPKYYSKKQRAILKSCKRKSRENYLKSLRTIEKLRKISETSSDLDNCALLQKNSKNTEIFKIPECSSPLENITLDSLNIYDFFPPTSLENTSYGTESSCTTLFPDSYTSETSSLMPHENLPSILESSSNISEFHKTQQVLLSPQSPKTEEEHFEFYEPREKLTKHHILQLISLYKQHPCLWDQSHNDFCETELCKISWQTITDEWNKYCKRKFTIAEVRIRMCTLCQRYLQESERLVLEGELDESTKFPYFEQLQFLGQQKSLQKRRELYNQQNAKVLETYQHFPILWHVSHYQLRQAKERSKAFQSISTALKLCGIHLSTLAVQKRIRSLRKCYRLEKIRYLYSQVEQTKFESSFKHYKRMQFLDKHIDPFKCRICGKIFANFTEYRDHVENENHGNIVDEDSETEQENEEEAERELIDTVGNNLIETEENCGTPNPNGNCATTENIKCKTLDVNESFINTPETPESIPNSENVNGNDVYLDNSFSVINEVLIYPPRCGEEIILNSMELEDDIIEEIMENVSNDDSFMTQSLDQFINSVSSLDDITLSDCMSPVSLPATLMAMKVTNLDVDNEIVIDQTNDIKSTNNGDQYGQDLNENEVEVHQKNIEQLENELDQSENDVADDFNQTNLENSETVHEENNSPPTLLVKVESLGYSLDLKLVTDHKKLETPNATLQYDDDHEVTTAEVDGIFARIPVNDIRKMIALYRKYPQIWNPNHLDYNSRNLRRQAWCSLTAEYCKAVGRQFSWRTLHRKLTDYAKYYKKLITEQQDYDKVENKWTFYEDLTFLNDVIPVHDELQRTVHHRDNNFKIIGIYKSIPQLWDIKHRDFNKRPVKQRNIEILCNRLQEEYNLQITPERLKNRLIELRSQYRAAKKQRLKALKTKPAFTADYEFYEALMFLDPYIDPFICEHCKMEFKKLTDYTHHLRKEHETKKVLRNQPLSQSDHIDDNDSQLGNVCHICGIKFSSRSNLVHHLQRHDGIRNYPCTMCSKKFYNAHSLKVHIRTHTKECPYTCEKCGNSFVSASKLNQHVKRHSNKKDFPCDYCPKAFFTAFERERHTRRHLNIRDKICPICDKTFVAGSSYYAHMMLHNDTKRFSCDRCDMKFAQYAGLYKHKKRHHKT